MSNIEKLPGSRLSISGIEHQIPIYEEYKDSNEISTEEISSYTQEEIEYFAKISFTGTQLHNLVYFQRLSDRCQSLGRIPTYDDLRDTFPTTEREESEAISQLYVKLEDPQKVWEEWILNSEIEKKKNSGTRLDPETTKGIWDSGISNPDTKELINNIDEPNTNEVEMHEILTILNLKLKRNLQIPSYIDTIVLKPVSEKQKKITIIDYKTGSKDLSKITFLDKIQALLMSTSVFFSLIDEKISFGISDWDATHPLKMKNLPHLKKRAVLGPHNFNNSISDYDLLFRIMDIKNSVTFILENPLTNQSVKVDYASIAQKAIDYLNDFNEFYFENKAQLKPSKTKIFSTPRFIPEKILDPERYSKNSSYQGTQTTLF